MKNKLIKNVYNWIMFYLLLLYNKKKLVTQFFDIIEFNII